MCGDMKAWKHTFDKKCILSIDSEYETLDVALKNLSITNRSLVKLLSTSNERPNML